MKYRFLVTLLVVAGFLSATSCELAPHLPLPSKPDHKATGLNYTSDPPDWASNAHATLVHYKTLVDYWVSRAAPDDEDYFDVEGGWNDDVELAQSLAPYWFLTGDEPLRRMLMEMAEKNRQAAYTGTKKKAPWYQPGDTRFVQGYHSQLVDVHHSAEEVTLIYPRLFLLDYGNPEPIELMTRMVWNFEDNMGAGERNWGQRVATGMLMRSPKFNGRYVDWHWPEDLGGPFEPQDVPQNFRATAAGLSLAWYYGPGHYFWQDRQYGFLKLHHNAWIAASNSIAEGKPALIPPSKILIKDLSFGGGDGWLYNDDLHGSGWAQAGSYTFQHFYYAMTADWILFRDHPNQQLRRFAQDASNIVGKAFHYRQSHEQIGNHTLDLDRAFMQWRAEVDTTVDDPGLLQRSAKNATTRMTAYNILLQMGNLQSATIEANHGFEYLKTYLEGKVVDGQWTSNLQTYTNDCPSPHDCLTDQVKFPGSDAFLMAALGGSGVYDGAYPTVYFSFADSGIDAASLVLAKNPKEVKFWVWNFGQAKDMGIRLWRFTEGAGEFTLGADFDRDGHMDRVLSKHPIPSTSKGAETRFHLPSGGLYLVRIRVLKPKPRDLSRLPDPAATSKDLRLIEGGAELRVHNIGLAPTGPFKVRLIDTDNQPIGPDRSLSLPAFNHLEPVIQTLKWYFSSPRRAAQAVIDPGGKLPEITKQNNVVSITQP